MSERLAAVSVVNVAESVLQTVSFFLYLSFRVFLGVSPPLFSACICVFIRFSTFVW